MSTLIQKLATWAVAHKKMLIITLLTAGLTGAVIHTISSYALVSVTIHSSPDMKNVMIEASSDYGAKKIGSGSGLHIVPQSTKSLIISAGSNIKTQTKVTIPWYRFTATEVQLRYDKNADKVAYRSTVSDACATYTPSADRLLSYSCTKPVSLTQYNTNSQWGNQLVSELYYPNGAVQPYGGGVIGITSLVGTDRIMPGPIAYVGAGGKVRFYQAPEKIADLADMATAAIFTNTQDMDDRRFILALSNGDVYLGTPTGETEAVSYTHVAAPAGYQSAYQQTLCAFSQQSAYCYRGRAQKGDDSNIATPLPLETISKVSFTDGSVLTLPLARRAILDNFYITQEGELYGKSYKKLYRFTKGDRRYEMTELAQNIDAVAAGADLYYIQKNSLYRVGENDTSYQIFHLENTILRKAYVYSDKVYVLGSYKTAPSVTHAYQLNDSDNTQPGDRLVDILPPDMRSFPEVYQINFVGSHIHIQLASRNAVASKAPAEATRNRIEQRLRDLIAQHQIDDSGLKITFSY